MAKQHKQIVSKYNYKKQKLHNNKQLNISHLVPNGLLGSVQLLSQNNKERNAIDKENKKEKETKT